MHRIILLACRDCSRRRLTACVPLRRTVWCHSSSSIVSWPIHGFRSLAISFGLQHLADLVSTEERYRLGLSSRIRARSWLRCFVALPDCSALGFLPRSRRQQTGMGACSHSFTDDYHFVPDRSCQRRAFGLSSSTVSTNSTMTPSMRFRRTAPAVTAPASNLHLSTPMQWPRQPPRSLSFRALGVARVIEQ